MSIYTKTLKKNNKNIKLAHLIENSRVSLELKSKSIDNHTFYGSPLLEKNKLDKIKMVFSFIYF